MAEGIRMRPEWECEACGKRNFIERHIGHGHGCRRSRGGGEVEFSYRSIEEHHGHRSSHGGKGGNAADGYPAPGSHAKGGGKGKAGKGGSKKSKSAPSVTSPPTLAPTESKISKDIAGTGRAIVSSSPLLCHSITSAIYVFLVGTLVFW